jgi:hypothetical protein
MTVRALQAVRMRNSKLISIYLLARCPRICKT